ncbi:MAG: hypothetical protein WC663_00340 [Patescibacteria group bacterium]|jgi:hypothetical protein
MSKNNKKEERRQKNLDYIKNLYKNQKSEKESYTAILNGDKTSAETNSLSLKTSYINKDLRNLIILTLVLIGISVAMYYYDLSTNFLGNIASNMLNGIVK